LKNKKVWNWGDPSIKFQDPFQDWDLLQIPQPFYFTPDYERRLSKLTRTRVLARQEPAPIPTTLRSFSVFMSQPQGLARALWIMENIFDLVS
jgi:hypothetical protein